MKYFLACTLALIINPVKISQINSFKQEAREAFNKGDYTSAIGKYRYLTDSLNVGEDPVLLNLANAYFLSKDTANAYAAYQSLTGSSISRVRSKAYHQMGIIKNEQGAPEEALRHFHDAIKADKDNMDARYNYELLKNYIKYPEIILNRIRLLVKQRRYKAARNFLVKKMQESRRIRQFKDYSDRIETIIVIDSLGRL